MISPPSFLIYQQLKSRKNLMTKKNPSKEKTSSPDCSTCNGLCCRHIAMHLDTPKTKTDWDNLRWYLLHEKVRVGVDHDKNWLIEFLSSCRYLRPDHKCGIYEKRPRICKIFPGSDTCEHHDPSPVYKVSFETESELTGWLDRKKIDWRWK
jgi:uncharacterized protein